VEDYRFGRVEPGRRGQVTQHRGGWFRVGGAVEVLEGGLLILCTPPRQQAGGHDRSAPAGRRAPPAVVGDRDAWLGPHLVTRYQKLIILHVADEMVDDVVARLAAPGLPSHWRKNLKACAGIEFCKLWFAETHKRSQVLVPELERRLEGNTAQLDVPITININRLRTPQNRCP
jgi:hypothetical protein